SMLERHLEAHLPYLVRHKGGEHLYHIMEGPSFAAVFYLHLARYASTAIMMAALFVTLALVSWTLLAIAAAVAVFYAIVVRRLSIDISYKSGEEQAAAVKAQTQLVNEGLTGVRYLKALFAIRDWVRDFDHEARGAQAAMRRSMFWASIPSRTLEYLVLALFLAIVMLAIGRGGSLVAEVPALAVYFLGITRILPTLSTLGNARMQIMQALPNLRMYCELRENVPLEPSADEGGPVPADLTRHTLEFERVSFAYGEKRVLDEFRAALDLGRVTAIVGLSGQGKSTIVDLILRFIEPQSGRLTLSGVDLQALNLREWRRRFGYLGQEPFLFHASIAENIRLGNPGVSDAAIEEALRVAGAAEFVRDMPLGTATVLADRGQSLSGGQRQRIALARAFVSQAEVLILDEPTSALDADTEMRIMSSLIDARRERGMLVVTHKESLLPLAHHVLVIQDGRVVEAGQQASLRDTGQHYRRIFNVAAGA
ncbi:MAG: ABC transporter ATP-binding protein, partial [Burkholderiales bacterium]